MYNLIIIIIIILIIVSNINSIYCSSSNNYPSSSSIKSNNNKYALSSKSTSKIHFNPIRSERIYDRDTGEILGDRKGKT